MTDDINEAPAVCARRPRVLLGFTGSVATIKAVELVRAVQGFADVRVVLTAKSRFFVDEKELRDLGAPVFVDEDEWKEYRRGDPVLHIELRRWADALVIAPLGANTLSLLATGACPNLLTCVARAWDLSFTPLTHPFLAAPAMNTFMWEHPITHTQLATLRSWGVHVIDPIVKVLACGDRGIGAMASVDTIVDHIRQHVAVVMPVASAAASASSASPSQASEASP